MLLRSSSTPILNSWLPHSRDSSPDHDLHVLQRTKSVSFTPPPNDEHKKLLPNHTLMQTRLQDPPKRNNNNNNDSIPHNNHKKTTITTNNKQKQVHQLIRQDQDDGKRLFSRLGLGAVAVLDEGRSEVVKEEDDGVQTLEVGGVMGSSGAGHICGGGGKDGNNGGDGNDYGDNEIFGFDENNSNFGSARTDAYYQRMIEANPSNALLLGNYAKFLKEVRADLAKAEEYCCRAILENPSDASLLSIYADLIWQAHKDAQRAESYFDQAIKAAPDDCYVLASYAKFLWDVDEKEDDDYDNNGDAVIKRQSEGQNTNIFPPNTFHGFSVRPLTAASQ